MIMITLQNISAGPGRRELGFHTGMDLPSLPRLQFVHDDDDDDDGNGNGNNDDDDDDDGDDDNYDGYNDKEGAQSRVSRCDRVP